MTLLLTKDEFLAWSLTPITTPSTDQESCPICTEPLIRPIRTPCKHIFCAACLTTWLKASNNCPLCRKEFFERKVVVPFFQPTWEELGFETDGEDWVGQGDEDEDDDFDNVDEGFFGGDDDDPDGDDLVGLFGRHVYFELPDYEHPDNDQLDDGQPDDDRPDDNRPDDNRPDDNHPDNNQPDNNQPDNNQAPGHPDQDAVDENDQDEINWPEDIEPFSLEDFDMEIDGHELSSIIEHFDAYLFDILNLTHGVHPILDIPTGHSLETHIDVSALMLSAIACIFRFASHPILEVNDFDAVHIHAMCRNEWTVVIQRLQHILPSMAHRELQRRGYEWPGFAVHALYLELKLELIDFPRINTVQNLAQRFALQQNPEVLRFRSEVDCLVRWIVTQAARDHHRNAEVA